MSNKHSQTLAAAFAVLDNLRHVFKAYQIGTKTESGTVPQALICDAPILNALKLIYDAAEVIANHSTKVLAISKWGWGINRNPLEAWKVCKRQTPIDKKTGEVNFYLIHPDTTIDAGGMWSYPVGFSPQKLEVSK